jgi:transposase-like protein
VAQSHGVNANVVFHLRRQYRERKLAETGLIPVVVIDEAPVKQVPSSASSSTIRIDLPCGAVILVEGSADLTLVLRA